MPVLRPLVARHLSSPLCLAAVRLPLPWLQVHLNKRGYSDDIEYHELAFETKWVVPPSVLHCADVYCIDGSARACHSPCLPQPCPAP